MKLLIIGTLLLIPTLFLSCHKEPIYNPIISNDPIIIHASSIIDVRASDVVTSKSLIIRKIEFINRQSSLLLDSFIITMQQLDTSRFIFTSLKEKTFKGTFKIESGNQTLYNINIDKGIIQNNEVQYSNGDKIKANLIPTCKVDLIHGCVSNAIKNMGIFEYGACLYSAPECYALLWAGCTFNYCVTGEQK